MTNMITNTEARDAVIAKILAAKTSQLFVSDWTRAKWLANGERVIGLVGGMRNMIVHSPANSRDKIDFDRFLVFGPAGVLVHEEAATAEKMALIGFGAPAQLSA